MKCDHCGVKRFVCLMYSYTDLNICEICSSDKKSFQSYINFIYIGTAIVTTRAIPFAHLEVYQRIHPMFDDCHMYRSSCIWQYILPFLSTCSTQRNRNRHSFCAVVNTTSDVLKGFRMTIGSKQINALTHLPLVHFEPFIVQRWRWILRQKK